MNMGMQNTCNVQLQYEHARYVLIASKMGNGRQCLFIYNIIIR